MSIVDLISCYRNVAAPFIVISDNNN